MIYSVVRVAVLIVVVMASVTLVGALQLRQGPTPPPPMAADYFPDTWARYGFDEGRFSARFPGKPVESIESPPSGVSAPSKHIVEYKGLLTYRVTYVDYPVVLEQKVKIEDLLQGTKNAMLRTETDPESKIVAERYVEVGGFKALYFQLDRGQNATLRIEVIPVGKRLYLFSAAGRRGNAREVEGADNFEKVARGFLDSIQVSDSPDTKPN
jgi:hypothetical protein